MKDQYRFVCYFEVPLFLYKMPAKYTAVDHNLAKEVVTRSVW